MFGEYLNQKETTKSHLYDKAYKKEAKRSSKAL
jgi:precorrin-4 methylase